jgi:hypothetical protein
MHIIDRNDRNRRPTDLHFACSIESKIVDDYVEFVQLYVKSARDRVTSFEPSQVCSIERVFAATMFVSLRLLDPTPSMVLLVAVLAVSPMRCFVNGDVTGTDPPIGSCLCMTSSSVIVRDNGN